MSAPFMQLYVADYLGDTQHLTTEQNGAYLLILMTMWRQGGSLPADQKILARIARVSPRRWHLIAEPVMAFFVEEDGKVTQKRLVEEYEKAVSKSEKRSISGKAGGEAKALKDKLGRVANAKRLPRHLSEPEPDTSEPIGSSAPGADDTQQAFDAWNEMATDRGLPLAQKLTPSRRSSLKARLSEVGGLPGWSAALAKVAASGFCTGQKTDFRADLDFVLQPRSFNRLVEGSYDDNPTPPTPGGRHEQHRPHSARPGFSAELRQGVRSALAGRRVPELVPQGDPGGGPEWSGHERADRMAGGTVTLERGEDGAYADREQHSRRYGGPRH